MNRILLLVFSIHFSLFTVAQNCNSLRYQDTIFRSVTNTTGIYFGTATPYGALAQPQDLFLDIYEPANDTLTKRPLIVFQFGGGFLIGWRTEPVIPEFCEYFAKCGYVVATIDYRLGFNATDQNSAMRAVYRGIQDERSAIRFLSARASQFRIDTSLIFLTGTSAGCFCALANAYMQETDRPAPTFGIPLEPADLGCPDCSGNNDLGHHIPRIKGVINQWGAILDTAYIEPGEDVPVISFHGDNDNIVPYGVGYPFSIPLFPPVYGSQPIHQRLNNLGVINELHTLTGYGHEPELLNAHLNDTIRNYSRMFLFNLLKPVTSDITGGTVSCLGSLSHYSVINTPGSRYCWSLTGNGSIVSNTGNSITVLWSDTGIVSVSVKELNHIAAEGQVKTFTTYIAPMVSSAFGYTTNELRAEFQNLSSNAENYEWNFGDGNFSDSINPTHDYVSGGTYTIKLIAGNSFCSDTFSTSITIDSCPVASISHQLNNQNALFYAAATNGFSYLWNFGDGDSVLIHFPNVFHQYDNSGEYTVTLTVKNQLGCEDSDTLTIFVGTSDVNDLTTRNIFVVADEDGFAVYGLQFPVHAELFDAVGKRIANCILSNLYNKLQAANCKPGLYLLRISDKGNTITKKLTTYY